MCHFGRKLPNHGQLARLHQLILRGAQRGFGLNALCHFLLQRLVGGLQISGALLHLVLQRLVGLLQCLLRRQLLTHMLAALVEQGRQQQSQGNEHPRNPCAAARKLQCCGQWR